VASYTALHDFEREQLLSHSPCFSPFKFSQRDHLLTRNGITTGITQFYLFLGGYFSTVNAAIENDYQ
jgi:hypothetical protein